MSLLGSVIASIDDSSKTTSKPRQDAPRPVPTGSTPRPVALDGRGSERASQGTLKRKAEEQATSQHLKVPKPHIAGSNSATTSRSSTASPAPRARLSTEAQSTQPYRGTNKVNSSESVTKKPNGSSKSHLVVQPRLASSAPNPAPKKGYLAILERAKAAQEAAKPFGQIKHQKKEKERLSSKARARLAEEAASESKKLSKAVGTPQAVPVRGKAQAVPINKVQDPKKKVEVGYKGTMRSTPPAYQGTMGRGGSKPGPSRTPQASAASSAGRPRYEKGYDDDHEDEDEDEDMDDYDSASSDMEAGLDDIAAEEMMSSRQARKEDEEALREESELKRQKLERQRKLQALNAAAAKKKKVY